ncbi:MULTISPECIES: Firmicu-CTERM sorting domain-containing protein [Lactobacillaceae]|uniref:Firmicu-CTERM sorting domain-containing protein n=1 Tax=Lactobacillaceae TaxID=33958 RepID=UPI0014569AE6|nr:Firmicu-CTERM sorting domain-containing protein [Lactobacillus sp. HBUAS51381]NLR10332.1 Firmicu-CTERM sorting domain-containing protein [Lactobacillus sp. HBUAS51381]
MKFRYLFILISTLGLSLCFGTVGHADTSATSVDWDNVTKTQVGYWTMNNVAMTTDSTGVNVYVDSGNTNSPLPLNNYTLTLNGQPYLITLQADGDRLTATAKAAFGSWPDLGTVGSGTLTTFGMIQTLTFRVNFTQLGVPAAKGDVNLTNSSLGGQTTSAAIVTNPATSILDGSGVTSDPEPIDPNTSSSTSTSTSTSSSTSATDSSSSDSADSSVSSDKSAGSSNVDNSSESSNSRSSSALTTSGNNQSGNLGITIDGNFDDWADKTTHAMKISGDDDNIKYASLLTDNDNIYFYVLMSPKLQGGYTNFQPDGYQLDVGGKTFYLSFNNHTTVNIDVNQKQAVPLNIYSSDGTNNNLIGHAYVARQYLDQKMGDGTTVRGSSYVFECAVPFKSLNGISNTTGQTIKLSNPNLWDGSIEAAGGSTGPIVLASAGFVIAIFGALKLSGFKFKRRR